MFDTVLPPSRGLDFNVNPLCATLSTKVEMERPFLPTDPETGQPGPQYEMHTWKEYCLPNAGTAERDICKCRFLLHLNQS